jgi:hypothetical protein
MVTLGKLVVSSDYRKISNWRPHVQKWSRQDQQKQIKIEQKEEMKNVNTSSIL